MKLAAARIFVREIAPALAFYRDLLGLPVVADGSGEGYVVFSAGGPWLVVEAVPAEAPAGEEGLVGRFAGLSFGVGDIHEQYRTLVSRGVMFSGVPEQQAWGGWLATFRDPAGNELQLVQNPG